MRNINIVAGLVVASGLLAAPAEAQLLKVGGSNAGNTSTTSVSAPSLADGDVTTGGTTQADATLLNGGGSTANVDLSSLLGPQSGANLTLPGSGDSSVDGTTNSVTGTGGTVDTLLSSLLGNDNGTGGTIVGTGGPGGLGGDGGVGGASGNGATSLAMLGAGAKAGNAQCTSDALGVARLLQQRYGEAQMAHWKRAVGIHVVKLPVCAQIRANVARTAALNGNIGAIQGVAASDPLMSASLSRAGSSASRVLGVGQAGGDLTVYVY